MAKRVAFVSPIRRAIPGLVRGQMIDLLVTNEGVALIPRLGPCTYNTTALLTWEELWDAGRKANRKRQKEACSEK